MGYIEKNLTPGEQVLHRTRLHWVVVFGPFLAAVVFGVGAIAALVTWWATRSEVYPRFSPTALLVLAAIAAALAISAFVTGVVRRAGIEMAVTNKRLIVKTGILRRTTTEMMLSKVESVSVDQSVLGRLLGYGDLLVRGSGGTAERFGRISDPLGFRRRVQEQTERSQSWSGAAPGPPAAAAGATSGNPWAPPSGAATQTFCGQCGAALPADVQFCPRCGARRTG